MESPQSKNNALPGGLSRLIAVSAFASLTAFVGCTSSNSRTPIAEHAESYDSPQGSSADVVLAFPGTHIADAGYPANSPPENWRRDAQLAARSDASAYPLDAWPAEPGPSVFWARRIRASTTADSFYFYETARHDYRDLRRWWHR